MGEYLRSVGCGFVVNRSAAFAIRRQLCSGGGEITLVVIHLGEFDGIEESTTTESS